MRIAKTLLIIAITEPICSVGRSGALRKGAVALSVVLGAFIGSTVAATPAGAAAQVVSNCNDSGPGSLRQAVLDASSGDTVNFASDLGCSTIVLTSGDIEIATDLSIVGPGPNALAVSGNNASQVFAISGATVNMSGITIEDGSLTTSASGGGLLNNGRLTMTQVALSGNSATYGGGIANFGTLTLDDSTVSGNTATYGGGLFNQGNATIGDSDISGNAAPDEFGGGIGNWETLKITNSTISNNGSTFGGGIWNFGDGSEAKGALTLTSSTISANTAEEGGGLANEGGSAAVTTSTIAANQATVLGGGIDNFSDSTSASLSVASSTISGNTGPTNSGGGIANSASASLTGTIVANSSSANDCNETGTITDLGYNVADDASCNFSEMTSVNASSAIDAYLGPLGANGGPTLTVPLLASSSVTPSPGPDPALGAIPSSFTLPTGESACSVPDQRGVPRSAPCDIGAFELLIDTVAFNSNGGAVVSSLSGPDGSSITLPSDTYPGHTFNGWFAQASGGTKVGGAGSSYAIPSGGITLFAQWTSSCAAGLHPHVLTASYAKSAFTGLFCVNAKGFGTYTQGMVSGFGSVTTVKGNTVIGALGKNVALFGSTNGSKSSFVELAPAPIKVGTFTLT